MTLGLDAMAHNADSPRSDSIPTLPLGTNLPVSFSLSRDIALNSSGRDVFSPSALDPTKAINESTGKCLIGRFFLKTMSLSPQIHS